MHIAIHSLQSVWLSPSVGGLLPVDSHNWVGRPLAEAISRAGIVTMESALFDAKAE